jgi:hypothetical protein
MLFLKTHYERCEVRWKLRIALQPPVNRRRSSDACSGLVKHLVLRIATTEQVRDQIQ